MYVCMYLADDSVDSKASMDKSLNASVCESFNI